MRYNVSKVWAVDDTTLYLEFNDERRGTYDMSKIVGDGVFKKLSDPDEFRVARSDGFTVVWPCGLDIAPEELSENCVAMQQRSMNDEWQFCPQRPARLSLRTAEQLVMRPHPHKPTDGV